jgi:ABC-type amino acid transport substrate-binding protein
MRAAALTLVLLASCDALPRDPEGTLEAARGGSLQVGVTEAAPWIMRAGDTAVGLEAEVVKGFAESIDAEVVWVWGPAEHHFERLETFELDLAATGLTRDSPWKKKLGVSRPYLGSSRVLVVPPGENDLLVTLDTYLEERKR